MNKVIRRPKPTMKDITPKDIRLLSLAYSLKDDTFLCFGNNYFRLQSLGLISDENQITYMGRQYMWELSQETVRQKKVIQ